MIASDLPVPLMRDTQNGFTLIEMVAMIVVMGVVAATAGVGMAQYAEAYRDSRARAEVVDMVDSALRRVSNDMDSALENSCRVATDVDGTQYLEVLLTRASGRFREFQNGGSGDVLDLTTADSSFDVLGPLQSPDATADELIVAGSDWVVINNVAATGDANNAYTANSSAAPGHCQNAPSRLGCNAARIDSITNPAGNEPLIQLQTARHFPSPDFSNLFIENPQAMTRFAVVSGPLSYSCKGSTDASGNGTGTLRRISGYPISYAQSLPTTGAIDAVAAQNVSSCMLRCGSGSATGLIELELTVRRGGQAVTLNHAVQTTFR